MNCPRCRGPLLRRDEPPFLLWACGRCGGHAATLAVLRKGIEHRFLSEMWDQTVGANRKGERRCPDCVTLMSRVPTTGPELDLCRRCQLVWFDAGELHDLPSRPEEEIRAEHWAQELRDHRRHRTDSEFYTAIIRGHGVFRA